ncbi:ABC-2 type transporter [Caldisphaera lagunensis DSM 15908]|uniref:ABC-2 type transporter n=1 Tax=Caldisphaera lagunensis (strain DSM 15908 / JCM 11604 / ANMR 0165 / IC-154) TaxID=1056495 RepID=L0A8T8_CALLD|nr:ABC-2 type transporter [Caldisphaera lagunensis DSM 15908]
MRTSKFNWRFVLAFIWFYGYSSIKRGYYYVLSYLALPLSLLFFIYIVSKGHLVQYAILGGIISIITSNALTAIGDTSFFKLELKLQELLIAADVSPIEYLLGIGLGNLLYSLPGLFVYFVLGFLYKIFSLSLLGLTILTLIIVMVAATSLAYMTGSRVSHMRNSWGVGSLLSVILTMLPPLYYPYTFLPKIALYPLILSPATPASIFLQDFMTKRIINYYSFLILLAETIIYLLLALKLGKWEE